MRVIVLVLAAVLALVAGRALLVWTESREGPGPLAVRWEGAVNDRNYRDLGESLNACLGAAVFATGQVHRAAQWFSGWSCEDVGRPDEILSLNFKPHVEERYYCRADGRNVVGRVDDGAETELNDLEFPETWDDPRQREPACWYLREAFRAVAEGRRLLVHCDAGRDRTGVVSALLAAAAAERRGRLDPPMIQALECDYRKSDSLAPAKYGRIERFVGGLQAKGGVEGFLRATCGLDEAVLSGAAERFLPR